MMTELSQSKPINLGFNNVIEDSCDYHDYSNVNTVSNFNGLAILQHNICGVLGKQDALKLLLKDITRDCRVQVIMMAETWLKRTMPNDLKYWVIASLVPTGKTNMVEELES